MELTKKRERMETKTKEKILDLWRTENWTKSGPKKDKKEKLAKELKVTIEQIENFINNTRSKIKKQNIKTPVLNKKGIVVDKDDENFLKNPPKNSKPKKIQKSDEDSSEDNDKEYTESSEEEEEEEVITTSTSEEEEEEKVEVKKVPKKVKVKEKVTKKEIVPQKSTKDESKISKLSKIIQDDHSSSEDEEFLEIENKKVSKEGYKYYIVTKSGKQWHSKKDLIEKYPKMKDYIKEFDEKLAKTLEKKKEIKKKEEMENKTLPTPAKKRTLLETIIKQKHERIEKERKEGIEEIIPTNEEKSRFKIPKKKMDLQIKKEKNEKDQKIKNIDEKAKAYLEKYDKEIGGLSKEIPKVDDLPIVPKFDISPKKPKKRLSWSENLFRVHDYEVDLDVYVDDVSKNTQKLPEEEEIMERIEERKEKSYEERKDNKRKDSYKREEQIDKKKKKENGQREASRFKNGFEGPKMNTDEHIVIEEDDEINIPENANTMILSPPSNIDELIWEGNVYHAPPNSLKEFLGEFQFIEIPSKKGDKINPLLTDYLKEITKGIINIEKKCELSTISEKPKKYEKLFFLKAYTHYKNEKPIDISKTIHTLNEKKRALVSQLLYIDFIFVTIDNIKNVKILEFLSDSMISENVKFIVVMKINEEGALEKNQKILFEKCKFQ